MDFLTSLTLSSLLQALHTSTAPSLISSLQSQCVQEVQCQARRAQEYLRQSGSAAHSAKSPHRFRRTSSTDTCAQVGKQNNSAKRQKKFSNLALPEHCPCVHLDRPAVFQSKTLIATVSSKYADPTSQYAVFSFTNPTLRHPSFLFSGSRSLSLPHGSSILVALLMSPMIVQLSATFISSVLRAPWIWVVAYLPKSSDPAESKFFLHTNAFLPYSVIYSVLHVPSLCFQLSFIIAMARRGTRVQFGTHNAEIF